MDFSPKLGCPMCGIVASAQNGAFNVPRAPVFPAGSTQPEILWRDDNFTVYREKANPVSSRGHLIVVFNLHVPSLYTLSATDIPLLIKAKSLAARLLTNLARGSSLPSSQPRPSTSMSPPLPVRSPSPSTPPAPSVEFAPGTPPRSYARDFELPPPPRTRVGFITPPFKDNKIPVTDHLHMHAFCEPADRLGWWRAVAYSPLAWYSIDDLIAEMRESTSNNRIKSGYEDRANAPIDSVSDAGARTGTAYGAETTEPGVASADIEAGDPGTGGTGGGRLPRGLGFGTPGGSRTGTPSASPLLLAVRPGEAPQRRGSSSSGSFLLTPPQRSAVPPLRL